MGLNRLGVIWFLANGVRVQDVAVAHTVVAGSNMAATPLKLPCFIASVGDGAHEGVVHYLASLFDVAEVEDLM